jgi:hypothetical protein
LDFAVFFEDFELVRVADAPFFEVVPALREVLRARLFAGADFLVAFVVAALRFAALRFATRAALLFALDLLAAIFRLPRFFALLFVDAFLPPPIFATTRFAAPVSRATVPAGERSAAGPLLVSTVARSISLLKRFPSSSERSAARLFRSNHSKNSSHPICSRESSPLKPGKSILRIPGSSSDPVAFTRAG